MLHLDGITTTGMTDNGQNYIAHAAVTLRPTACPLCHGVKKFMGRTDAKIIGAEVIFSRDYTTYLEGDLRTTFKGYFYECAGCGGKGTRAAYTARVLAGEFTPGVASQAS